MSTCAGTKRDGTPCPMPAAEGSGYCWNHDPAHAGKRSKSARHAATAKHSSAHREVREVRLLVKDLIEVLVVGDLRPDIKEELTNVTQLLQAYARLAELELSADERPKRAFPDSPGISLAAKAEDFVNKAERERDADAERARENLFAAVEKLREGDWDGAAELMNDEP